MDIVKGILSESYDLYLEMAPYLLFGFIVAGILHVFINTKTIARHLGGDNFASVFKAALIGVPMPLCSCGVIPAALALRKDGASKGAVLSFMVSTPATGIDTILATYALMGGFFAGFRVLGEFVGAFIVGILANLLLPKDAMPATPPEEKTCSCCSTAMPDQKRSWRSKVAGVFSYAFGTLLAESGGWIVLGVLLGGVIAFFVPPSFVQSYIGSGLRSIVIMMAVAMPMYICSSGSIPVAMSLMMKGLNPGAAFAFLFAGPATNTVTIVAVAKNLGVPAAILYVSSIAIVSIGFGLVLDSLWVHLNISPLAHHHATAFIPLWAKQIAGLILMMFIVFPYLRRFYKK